MPMKYIANSILQGIEGNHGALAMRLIVLVFVGSLLWLGNNFMTTLLETQKNTLQSVSNINGKLSSIEIKLNRMEIRTEQRAGEYERRLNRLEDTMYENYGPRPREQQDTFYIPKISPKEEINAN